MKPISNDIRKLSQNILDNIVYNESEEGLLFNNLNDKLLYLHLVCYLEDIYPFINPLGWN